MASKLEALARHFRDSSVGVVYNHSMYSMGSFTVRCGGGVTATAPSIEAAAEEAIRQIVDDAERKSRSVLHAVSDLKALLIEGDDGE